MKKILLFLALLLTLGVSSQNNKADSLKERLLSVKNDTARALLLNDIARAYLAVSDFEPALNYSLEQLAISERTDYKRGLISSNNNIGLIYFYRGNFSKCLEYYFKALKVAEDSHNATKALKILSNIGSVYYSLQDYTKATEIGNKVIKLAKELGDSTSLASQYSNIGLIYINKAKKIKDSLKHRELCIKALRNFQEAVLIDSIMGNLPAMSSFYTNIGLAFQELNDPVNELKYHLYSLKVKQEVGDNYGIGICFGNLGVYYLRYNNFIAADSCLHYALKIAELTDDKESLQQMHTALSELYKKQKKWELSLDHYQKAVAYRDTIMNAENTKKQLEIAMNYDYVKKETELKAEAKIEKDRQQLIIYGVCIGLFLVLVFAGFMYNRFKVTQRQKKLIEIKEHETQLQKELIEEKNEEIISSIRYAKRIQQSLLPQDKYIDKNLKRMK